MKEILGKIVRLRVSPDLVPHWYRQAYPAHVPLPSVSSRHLDGEIVAWAEDRMDRIPLIAMSDGKIDTAFDWPSWTSYVLEERYRTLRRPWYTYVPIHYHRAPAGLRNLAARVHLSALPTATAPRTTFPGFPIEQGFELLCDVYQQLGQRRSPSPIAPSEVTLTHDIDTAAGFKAVKETARLERDHGFRSIFNVVACGYAIDHDVLDWLAAEGFRIGSHGYNHDNRLAFLSEKQIRRRLDRCVPLIERYNIKVFRSPCWLRTRRLFSIVKDYFEEDYSYLDADVTCPGGVGGCLWTRPFAVDGLTHVPTTIPFEVPGLIGLPPDQWMAFWRDKIDWLRACRGGLVVNTHPDPHRSGNAPALRAYEKLLELLSETKSTGSHEAVYRAQSTMAQAS